MPLRIAVIGSGFAGLLIGIKLRAAGIESFTIYEKADSLGGTWRDNTYPGAACDVPALLYCYSFEPKPDWSRKYAEQPEIKGYLEHCARKYGLDSHLRFGTEIASAEFDAAAAVWQLRSTRGEGFQADVLISACGQLNRPAYPQIPGRAAFAGPQFHSAAWRHDISLAGRRVAVIGTGASAVQFVPPVVEQAAALTLFQRTPPWIVPKPDRQYGPAERALYQRLPSLQSLQRGLFYAMFESGFGALRAGSLANRLAQKLCERHLRKSVPDEGLRKRLLPDYPAGCKRILISNDYYPALAQPKVSLVTEPIGEIRPQGPVTQDGVCHPADVLIYGTGFQATSFLTPMRIIGLDGQALSEVWQQGAAAYLGLSVPRFPNLFLLYGPNTNLGHNSILYMLESQARYIMSGIAALRASGARYLDVKAERLVHFQEELKRRFAGSTWAAGCTSWYKTPSGHNTNNWPGYTFEYRRRTRRLKRADYHMA